jgi:hypothetical protein
VALIIVCSNLVKHGKRVFQRDWMSCAYTRVMCKNNKKKHKKSPRTRKLLSICFVLKNGTCATRCIAEIISNVRLRFCYLFTIDSVFNITFDASAHTCVCTRMYTHIRTYAFFIVEKSLNCDVIYNLADVYYTFANYEVFSSAIWVFKIACIFDILVKMKTRKNGDESSLNMNLRKS